jgi:hypothetical protein
VGKQTVNAERGRVNKRSESLNRRCVTPRAHFRPTWGKTPPTWSIFFHRPTAFLKSILTKITVTQGWS